MSTSFAQPVPDEQRDTTLGVLRGFALLGILVMNVQSFSMISAAYLNPTAYGDLTGANRWVWTLSHLLFDQKMYGIFSMLFGAGIALMTSRVEARGARSAALHYRRMAWPVQLFIGARWRWTWAGSACSCSCVPRAASSGCGSR
jgi:uncharacterized protein